MKMSIKIDISLCRVCMKQVPGINIYTGNILEKFKYATLVQVSELRKISSTTYNQQLSSIYFIYNLHIVCIVCILVLFCTNSNEHVESNRFLWKWIS